MSENRKPEKLKKETIRQAAADLGRLQLSSSNSQVIMMDISSATTSISETSAKTSKPVISSNGTTPSNHQQPFNTAWPMGTDNLLLSQATPALRTPN